MYLKRFIIIVLTIFFISLISGISLFNYKNKTPLYLVTESVLADDGSVYFLEQSNNNCNIYHIDDNGNILDKICSDKISDDYYYQLLNMKYYNDNLYVVLYKNSIVDTSDYNNSLFKCNFEKNTLEEVVNLNEIQTFYYSFDDDTLYLSYSDVDYTLQEKIINERFSKNENIPIYDDYAPCSKIISDNYNNTYIIDLHSQLMKFSENNQAELIYPVSENRKISEFSYDGSEKLYFIDCTENVLMYYDIEADECFTADNSFLIQSNYSLSSFRNIKFNSNGDFVCSVDNMNGGYSLALYKDGQFKVFDSISGDNNPVQIFLIIAGYTVVIFIILAAATVLVYIFVFKYISLIIRTGAVFLLISCISGAVIFASMKNYLNSSFNDFLDDKILYMAENRVKQLEGYSDSDIKGLLDTDLGMIEYSDLNEIQTIVYNVIAYYESGNIVEVQDYLNLEDNINIDYSYYYSLYIIDENSNNIQMVFNSNLESDIPAEYIKNRYVCDTVEKVMKTGNKYIVTDLYAMQECTAAYVPLYSSDGNISAVVEVSMINNKETLSRVNEIINANIYKICFIMLIIITIISVFFIIFLRPLKELKNKATELMHGNMGVSVKVYGNNEITILSEQFNHISLKLAENISDMQLLKKYYKYYVPEQLLNIFKKNNISDISTGDKEVISLAVLRVSLHIENIEIESHHFIDIINEFLGKISQITEKYNGIIEYYSRHEIKILFNEKYHNAVRTAVAISEFADEKINYCNVSVKSIVNFEKCSFNVIGNQKRISISSSSEDFISADNFYTSCNIIVTDSIADKCNDFFKIFNVRFIGIAQCSNRNIKLFEVFNGGNLHIQNIKGFYKDKFETAVRLYMMKNYREARNIFIEIFENYPQDNLVKNYIYSCDNLLKGENL